MLEGDGVAIKEELDESLHEEGEAGTVLSFSGDAGKVVFFGKAAMSKSGFFLAGGEAFLTGGETAFCSSGTFSLMASVLDITVAF